MSELGRGLPHDIGNALAAAAVASGAGATPEAIRHTLESFEPTGHRLQPVADVGGVVFYDDSSATTPAATLAAVRALGDPVLIAGGRNKGLDLAVLSDGADHVRAVVAMGEAAGEIAEVFTGSRPVEIATGMDDAVARAGALAEPGGAVVLSPACASFDRYEGCGQRGEDFIRAVRELGALTAGGGSMIALASNARTRAAARQRHPTARVEPDGRGPSRPVGRRTGLFLVLFLAVTTLTLFGVVMVLSATAAASLSNTDSAWSLFRRHLLWTAAGTVALLITLRVDYHRWRVLAVPGLIVSLLLLVLVTLPGVGISTNGARRWLWVGPFTFQPSESAKLALVLFIADLLGRPSRPISKTRLTLRPVVTVAALIIVLLMAQPHLGASIIITVITLAVLFLAGTSMPHMVVTGTVGAVLAGAMVAVSPVAPGTLVGLFGSVGGPAGQRLPAAPVPSRHCHRRSGRSGVGIEPGQVGVPSLRSHRFHLRHNCRGTGVGGHSGGGGTVHGDRSHGVPGGAAGPRRLRDAVGHRRDRVDRRSGCAQHGSGAGLGPGVGDDPAVPVVRWVFPGGDHGRSRPAPQRVSPDPMSGPGSTWAVIAGGGTAGHVLPGLSMAREMVARGTPPAAVHFVGTKRGIETRLVSEAGFGLTTLPGRGLKRRFTAANLAAITDLIRALVGSFRLLRRHRPAVVVGLGGYASVACGAAAVVLRIPLVITEQNAVPRRRQPAPGSLGPRGGGRFPRYRVAGCGVDREPASDPRC